MRREGGSIQSEAEIEALHASLTTHFDQLRVERGDAPIYLLEHGLCGADLDALFGAARACLPDHPTDGDWWASNALPLLIAMTEIGYVYRGTGTDYWPILADRLGNVPLGDRAALSNLFRSASGRFGLARPAETAWNHAFCHIAWPVLHAILPIELHRPLARALRDVRTHLNTSGGDAELIAPIRNRAQLAGGERLIAWLEDERTAAAVVRQFLDPGSQHAMSSSALTRIARDLGGDETASEALRDARKRQKALGAQPPRRTTRRQRASATLFAPLVLRLNDQRLSLALKIPQMDPAVRDVARAAVDVMRWRAFLWGQGRPVPGRNIFSDHPLPLNVDTLPPSDVALLGDVASLPLAHDAKDFLASLRVNTTAPIMFSDQGVDGDAIQLLSGTISRGGRYIILVDQDRPPASAEALGRVAGLRAYRIDTNQLEEAGWLAHIGFAIQESARLTWLGAPEVEQHRPARWFRKGDYIAFEVATAGASFGVRLIAPDGTRSELASTDHVYAGFIAEQVGTYTLHYGDGAMTAFDVIEQDDGRDLVTVDIDVGTGTIGDLADRHVTLRIDSDATLQEAEIEFRLFCDGRETARVRDTLPDTPCRLGGDHAIWEALLSREVLERLLLSNAAELGVSIDGLVDVRFRFEQVAAPFDWQRDPAGTLSAVDESGELTVFMMYPQRPLQVTLSGGPDERSDIVLYRAGHDAPLSAGGVCVGPRVWRASNAQAAQKPARLLRRLEGGRGDMADGSSIVGALIAWSSASVDHPVTQYRRGQIARQLERWLVEQLCGAEWADQEAILVGGAETSPASAFLKACAQLRIGYADVGLSRFQHSLLDRILLRLIEARGLSISFQANRGPIDDAFAMALDDLFNDSYVVLRDEIESAGHSCPFDPDVDVDVGEVSDNWNRALRIAVSQGALIELVDLLRPLEAGDSLSLADFETMLPEDDVDLLYAWITRHVPAHHARNWTRDLVEAAYWLFAKPAVASRLSWRAATERLLADSFSARAIRYVALRAAGGSRRSA